MEFFWGVQEADSEERTSVGGFQRGIPKVDVDEPEAAAQEGQELVFGQDVHQVVLNHE